MVCIYCTGIRSGCVSAQAYTVAVLGKVAVFVAVLRRATSLHHSIYAAHLHPALCLSASAPSCRWASVRSLLIGMVLTLFDVFDVPVFWPILMLYFLALFFVTMKSRIKHMVKYKYIPFSLGKKVRGGRAGGGGSGSSGGATAA